MMKKHLFICLFVYFGVDASQSSVLNDVHNDVLDFNYHQVDILYSGYEK